MSLKQAIKAGDFDLAIAICTNELLQLQNSQPQNNKKPKFYLKRAGLYCAKENWDKAIEDSSAVLADAPPNKKMNKTYKTANQIRAFAYLNKSEFFNLLKDDGKSIRIPRLNHELSAMIYDSCGKDIKAFDKCRKALGRDPASFCDKPLLLREYLRLRKKVISSAGA
jgi:tetratricopeptide (TPR) repeat protein